MSGEENEKQSSKNDTELQYETPTEVAGRKYSSTSSSRDNEPSKGVNNETSNTVSLHRNIYLHIYIKVITFPFFPKQTL